MNADTGEASASQSDASSPRSSRSLRNLTLGILLLVMVVGVRGKMLAKLMGGSYPTSSIFVDSGLLLAFVLVLRGFDYGLKMGVRKLIPATTPVRRWGGHLLYGAVAVLVAGPLIIATLQLHPQKIGCATDPSFLDLPFERVTLVSDGLHLDAWYIEGGKGADQVVVAHGIGANKANFLPACEVVHALGLGCLIFDFRGHGDSDGRTISLGYREASDVFAAHAWLRDRFPDARIHAIGYSMGGSAVLKCARDRDLFDRIVIDSSFATLRSAALGSALKPLGPLGPAVWNLARLPAYLWTGVDLETHRPVEYIAQLSSHPILVIHGTDDRMIAAEESERLHRAAPQSQLWLVEGAGHVAAMTSPRYRAQLARFFGLPRASDATAPTGEPR